MKLTISIAAAILADPRNKETIIAAARAAYKGDADLSVIEQNIRHVSADDEHIWHAQLDELRAAEEAWFEAHKHLDLPEDIQLTFGSWSRIEQAIEAIANNNAWRTTHGK
jgi:hypothetical protein